MSSTPNSSAILEVRSTLSESTTTIWSAHPATLANAFGKLVSSFFVWIMIVTGTVIRSNSFHGTIYLRLSISLTRSDARLKVAVVSRSNVRRTKPAIADLAPPNEKIERDRNATEIPIEKSGADVASARAVSKLRKSAQPVTAVGTA